MKGISVKYNEDYTKCQVVVSVTTNGKRTRYKQTFYVENEKNSKAERIMELENKAIEFRNKHKKEDFMRGEITTFEEFVDIFMKKYAKKELSPSTVERYKQLYSRAIKSPLGKMYLSDIKPIDLIKFYESLEEKQVIKYKSGKVKEYYLSRQTILHHQKAIGVLFSKAKYWQYVKENITQRVENIKVKHKEIEVLSLKEIKQMLELLENEDIIYKTIIYIAVLCGCRRGEICSLRWDDINFETKTLTVRRNVLYIPKVGIVEKTPKTETSIRTLTMPDKLINILKEYKVWQDKERLKYGYKNTGKLFTNWTGEDKNILIPDTVSNWFSAFISRNGFKQVHFHSLRHANISILVAKGIDPKVISKRAGHSSFDITLEIYAKEEEEQDIIAAKRLDEALA